MQSGEADRAGISQGTSLREIGEFWDSHDFTDFDSDRPDVEFDARCAVSIDVELYGALEQYARRHGIRVETLVNLWLTERLSRADSVAP